MASAFFAFFLGCCFGIANEYYIKYKNRSANTDEVLSTVTVPMNQSKHPELTYLHTENLNIQSLNSQTWIEDISPTNLMGSIKQQLLENNNETKLPPAYHEVVQCSSIMITMEQYSLPPPYEDLLRETTRESEADF